MRGASVAPWWGNRGSTKSATGRNRVPQGSFSSHGQAIGACRSEKKGMKTMNENRNQGQGQGGQGQDRNQRQDPNQKTQEQRGEGQFGDKERNEGGQRGGDQGRQQQGDQRVGQDRNRQTAR